MAVAHEHPVLHEVGELDEWSELDKLSELSSLGFIRWCQVRVRIKIMAESDELS